MKCKHDKIYLVSLVASIQKVLQNIRSLLDLDYLEGFWESVVSVFVGVEKDLDTVCVYTLELPL